MPPSPGGIYASDTSGGRARVHIAPCHAFQRFLVRTEVRVRFGLIAEGVALEEGAIAMWIPGPRSGNAQQYAIAFALGRLLSIRVARVCNDMEVFSSKYSFRSGSHRLQAPIISRI